MPISYLCHFQSKNPIPKVQSRAGCVSALSHVEHMPTLFGVSFTSYIRYQLPTFRACCIGVIVLDPSNIRPLVLCPKVNVSTSESHSHTYFLPPLHDSLQIYGTHLLLNICNLKMTNSQQNLT